MLTEAELLAKVPTGLYINGQWVEGSAKTPISVEDPATGKTLLTIANATAEDGMKALTAAADGRHGSVSVVAAEPLRPSQALLAARAA